MEIKTENGEWLVKPEVRHDDKGRCNYYESFDQVEEGVFLDDVWVIIRYSLTDKDKLKGFLVCEPLTFIPISSFLYDPMSTR